MLKFINKKPDEESLLCTGQLAVYSHRVATPIRVMGIALRQIKYLIELHDMHKEIFDQYNITTPIIEVDVDVRKATFENLEKTFERYINYINDAKRIFRSYIIMIPFFSAEISKKIVQELNNKGRSYSFSIFLSHYVECEEIDILSIPVLKTQIYDTISKRRIQLVNAEQYIRYVEYSMKYFGERTHKPFFVPFPKLPDKELPALLSYFIESKYTNILLDYEGSSFKKLSDLIRLLQTEYDREGLFNKLILYGTRILREAVAKRSDDEVKFADVLALAGIDILGSNYKKRALIEEERPIFRQEETVERFFNNETYGYRHEKYLKDSFEEIHEIIKEISLEKYSHEIKRVLFKIINVDSHRKEVRKYIDLASKGKDLHEYLKTKTYVKAEDLKIIRRAPSEHKLDEYL